MKNIIYLCGQVSIKAPESYSWRNRFTNYMTEKGYIPNKIEVIDPCSNPWNQDILEKEYKTEPYLQKGTGILPFKDRNYVKISTICICNLNLYDIHKPLIGTLFEIAFASEDNSKTIFGIHNGETNDIYRKHPFIRGAIRDDLWFRDEIQIAKIIERFFI